MSSLAPPILPSWKSGFAPRDGMRWRGEFPEPILHFAPCLGPVGIAADVSRFRRHAGFSNVTPSSIWGLDKVSYFQPDGTDDYIDFGAIRPTSAFTIAAWFKQGTLSSTYRPIAGELNTTGPTGYGIFSYSNGRGYFYVRGTSGSATINASLASYNSDWIFIVGTYDSSLATERVKLFFNGVKVTTSNGPSGDVTYSGQPNSFYIGREGASASFHYSNNKISETLLWNCALSQEKVQRLYGLGIGGLLKRRSFFSASSPPTESTGVVQQGTSSATGQDSTAVTSNAAVVSQGSASASGNDSAGGSISSAVVSQGSSLTNGIDLVAITTVTATVSQGSVSTVGQDAVGVSEKLAIVSVGACSAAGQDSVVTIGIIGLVSQGMTNGSGQDSLASTSSIGQVSQSGSNSTGNDSSAVTSLTVIVSQGSCPAFGGEILGITISAASVSQGTVSSVGSDTVASSTSLGIVDVGTASATGMDLVAIVKDDDVITHKWPTSIFRYPKH
ncbi:LamG domain-containing protein [Candidatus Kaiserbacteria bacterium]|nr:LamG domain-containing protein [Candidatus Kaiserbacteria bacterium]